MCWSVHRHSCLQFLEPFQEITSSWVDLLFRPDRLDHQKSLAVGTDIVVGATDIRDIPSFEEASASRLRTSGDSRCPRTSAYCQCDRTVLVGARATSVPNRHRLRFAISRGPGMLARETSSRPDSSDG